MLYESLKIHPSYFQSEPDRTEQKKQNNKNRYGLLRHCPKHDFVYERHVWSMKINGKQYQILPAWTRQSMSFYGIPDEPCPVCQGQPRIIRMNPDE